MDKNILDNNNDNLINNILESLPSPVFIKDIYGKYIYSNQAYCDYMKRDKKDIIGKTILEIEPNKDHNESIMKDMEVLATKKKVSYELRRTNDERKYSNVLIHKNVIYNTNGTVSGIIAIITDISELKSVESKLIKSEEKIRAITEMSFDGIFLVNEFGKVEYWNKAAESIFGYSKEEMLEKELDSKFRLFRYNDEENFDSNNLEMIAIGKNGNNTPVELSLYSINMENKISTVAMIKDITYRKAYEKNIIEANRSLKKLKTAIEGSNAVIVITDINGNIEYANSAFEITTGYTFEEVKGKNPNALKSGVHDASFYEDLWKTIRSGNIWRGEFCNKKKSGELFYEDAIISPVKEEDGTIISFIAIKTDITDKKKYEKELQELSATKDKFFSIIAHDLKGPVGGIAFLLDELLRNENEFSHSELLLTLSHIKDAAHNTYNLLLNLLDWARSQKGEIKYRPDIYPISELVEESINVQMTAINKKEIKIERNIDKTINLFCDRDMLVTVFRNLINNAIKFSKVNGTIKIICMRIDEKIEISISDNGVGIDENRIKGLFNLTENTSTEGTKGEKGTGLGLILCKEFVEKNGGKIFAKSRVGEGSTFTIILIK